jgi:hypothetical protein
MAAADVLDELINGGTTAPVEAGTGAGAALGVAEPTPVAVAGGVRAMRWSNNTSGFVLRRMAALVTDGSRSDKVFKEKDVNQSGQSP